MVKSTRLLGLLIILVIVSGCAPKGRYYQKQDSAPNEVPQKVTTQDAIATYQTYAPANMRPYTIRGIGTDHSIQVKVSAIRVMRVGMDKNFMVT